MRIAASASIRTLYPGLESIPPIGGAYMDLTLILDSEWDDIYLAQDRQLRYVVVSSRASIERLLKNVGFLEND